MQKFFIIILFTIFSSLTSVSFAEIIKFPAATYEGEVKKGKAHGVGIFTFEDGSIYKGKVKKNKIHGKGKFTDAKGKTYEGKFVWGSLKTKLDKKTRGVIKLKPKTGIENIVEMKGTGLVSKKWFEAEKNSSGTYELTAKGKRDMDLADKEAKSGGGTGGSGGSGGSGC